MSVQGRAPAEVAAPDPDIEVFEFPCSYGQIRLWLIDQLSPGNPFYNIHATLRMATRLDPAALRRALAALLARHEALRTCFAAGGKEPVQRVLARLDPPLSVTALAVPDAAAFEAALRRLAEAEAQRPFDLTRAPLLRAVLVQAGAPQGDALLLTVHHIVADAWSMGVLLRDLSALYAVEAFPQPRPPALPDLPIQYADYAAWQRETLAGQALEEEIEHWRARLAGAPVLDLPLDRLRPKVPSHRGAACRFGLGAELSRDVAALAAAEDATPFHVLLAAFAVLLQRWSGQSDIVLGMPVANRSRAEVESVVGFFVNTLPLRLDLSGDPPFRELVARVRAAALEALAHQDLPFERLVERLNPARDPSRNPLFQVTFQVLNTPTGAPAGADGGGGAQILEIQRGAANFDLVVDLWRDGDAFEGRIDYATDLLEEATVARMTAQYRHLLAQAAAAPAAPVGALEVVPPEERAALLRAGRGPRPAYPRDETVQGRFARVAAGRGEAPALYDAAPGGGTLTYSALDRRANALAGALRALGAGDGGAVALCCPRGPAQVLAALAILKAGCAYLAIDLEHPDAWLRFVLEDAGIALGIGMQAQSGAIAALGLKPLAVAADCAGPEAAAPPEAGAAELAYLAYTSGSTGRPKGVRARHRGVLRLVHGGGVLEFGAQERFLAHSPLSFDASTLEIWGALLNGGTVVTAPPGPLALSDYAALLDGHGVTVAWLTAGLFHQLAEAHPDSLARVRRLFAGGDVLAAAAVRRVLARGGRVINGYGPTETTTFACCHPMARLEEVPDAVPIGRPIAHTSVLVLDVRMRLAPTGVPGELHIGGDGVAGGYLNRPELTAERFVANPFNPNGEDTVLYRTGDLVRWRLDGTLDFLGRVDRQMKLRGFRVEPGAVEAALESLPGLRQALVLSIGEEAGERTLLAAVAGDDPALLAPGPLRAELARLLPAHMLPSAFVAFERLPLTANGKVDQAAIRAAAAAAPQATAPAVAPEGELEALVAEIWARVLGREAVDVERGFFAEYGGHSLMATQVVARLRAALEADIPLRLIFEAPTVRGLAQAIERHLLAEPEPQGAAGTSS